ncbi:CBS domain-containing protein [Acidocella sp.]|uniref:CBS domain-containing protein n=1 Tax=Acidocella sp. TaxID=50710 RepID=UPI0026107C39|nr:CBS domain-containing protein [Acidocella sp.]
MNLSHILHGKPAGFIYVAPTTPIRDVVTVLAEKSIGAVLVLEGETLVGILSERDIVRRLGQEAGNTLDLTTAQLMTPNPITATPGTTVEQAMETMTNRHFRHLPIVDQGKLVGLVSIGDVVKARIEQHQYEVESLRTYVGGRV